MKQMSWIVTFALGCWISATLPVAAVRAAQSATVKVGVKPVEPFVFAPDKTKPSGYSIDLWQAIAPYLNRQTQFTTYDSVPQLLNAVKQGEVEVAIAAISITADREAEGLDFSQPIYQAGLQLVALKQQGPPLTQLLGYLGGWAALKAVSRVFLCSLVVGGAIWFLERDHNPRFKHDPLRGIGQGVWFAIVTLGTFGYGDVTPMRFSGRVIAGLWMAVSFFILADFIATMTVARQQYAPVQSLQDLSGQPIGATQGTTAAAFLATQPVKAIDYGSFDQLVGGLRAGKVAAILLDRPAAEYFVSRNQDCRLAGNRLNLEYYGIAVKQGNYQLLEQINRAILKLQEQGLLQYLDSKWFGKSDAHLPNQSGRLIKVALVATAL